MRVKIFIIISILGLVFCSCTQSNISTVHIVKEGDYTIELKKFTILSKEYDFNIVNYNDINYISTNDAYEIISLIAKQTNKYNLDSGNIRDVFDWENNQINIELTKVISPARAIFFQKPNYFMISGIEDFKNYRVENTLLNDFNISYINVNNTIYLPLMLLNYSVFDNEYMLYPAPDNKSFTLDETITFSNLDEQFINSIDSSSAKVLYDSPTLRKFSANYLYEFIKRNYPYISIRHNDLLSLDLDSINTNDDYVIYLFKILDGLDDLHTLLRMAPVINDPTSLNNSNILRNMSNLTKAIEANPSFASSEYKIVGDNLGYIRVHSFANDNNSFFNKLPYILKEFNNTNGLILDLRYNQGGLISNIFNLLHPFVKDNNSIKIHYSQLINGELTAIKNFELTKTGNLYYEKPIVLLTNRFTYSAGNMFAGIFKDNKLGTVIGEKTQGGGSSRIINVLPDGSSFYFSNPDAILYNRNGEFFETGIEPDILVEENIENNNDQILEKAIEYLINN